MSINKKLNIPICENIFQPLDFLEKISENDIILLDNYFKTKWYEEPYGNDFLEKLLEKYPNKNFQIICISDRWERLCEWYNGWKKANEKWWIKGWCQEKNGEEIIYML